MAYPGAPQPQYPQPQYPQPQYGQPQPVQPQYPPAAPPQYPQAQYPVPGYPQPAYPPYGAAGFTAPPPSPALVPSMRIDLIQGTSFGVAYPAVQSTPSGPSIGSLVAGIASILVALFAMCLGVGGANDGWGPAAGGAFTALGVFLGAGAVGLGISGTRQIRKAAAAAASVVTGRGMAITGIVLGSVGGGLAVFALLLAFLLAA